MILACPPGHAFAGRTVTLDELRAESLIVMQEGAGVRQIIEDELRALGTRLRDLDVRLELGLQESVRSAVQAGYGVTFISRSAVEPELAAGTLAAARVEGLDAKREISLVRSSGRTATRAADAFVEFARAQLAAEHDRPLGARGASRARWGAPARRREPALARRARRRRPVGGGPVPPDRGPGRASTRSSPSAAAARSTPPRPPPRRAACRSSRSRRPTPARSGRSSSASATPTERCAAAAPGRGCTRSSTSRADLDLPLAETVGTALNALAHCAEALYVEGHNAEADAEALEGARLIASWLPEVVERPGDLEARTELLRGACHAGAALGKSFLALGHAIAQALGGRYGLPHGALNALTLPPRSASTQPVAADAIARFGEALGSDDPAARVEELARLGGFERLRDLGVPEDAPAEVAESVAAVPAPGRTRGRSPRRRWRPCCARSGDQQVPAATVPPGPAR